VGSNQLISTGVTAASYTAASITVDADGRITAASSGSAGAGGFQPLLVTSGASSGTYTGAGGSRLNVYAYAAEGGNGGQGISDGNQPGGSGGVGGWGYFSAPIAAPYSAPWSIGANGNNGNRINPIAGNPGNAGGATTFGNFATVNGGNGGSGGGPSYSPTPAAPGNAGTAPGGTQFPAPQKATVTGYTGNQALFVFENNGT
jgi:hypothetical protein